MAGFWKLTGTIFDAAGRPARHRIRVLLPTSYADTLGQTVARQLAGRTPYTQYGTFSIDLPNNTEAALTIAVDNGPTLYKVIPARTVDITWSALEATIGDWETEAGTLPAGYLTAADVEALVAGATGTSGTIADDWYDPDVSAPAATDLASTMWAADTAPTFTNPAVFPIGDWATNAEAWSAPNIKSTTNVSIMMSNHDIALTEGLPGLFMIDPNSDGTAGPHEGTVGVETEAWALSDEWDMKDDTGAITSVWTTGDGSLTRASAEAAMIPSDRLAYANVGKGFIYGPALKATPFANLVDILSGDVYPYTDTEFTTGGYPQCQYLGLASDAGATARRAASYYLAHKRLRERLDTPKPTGQVIELTATSGKATVQPAQSVGAAWASIIAGAQFIVWFYQTPYVAPADPYNPATAYTWPASVTHDGKTWGTRPQVVTTTGVTPGTNDDVWGEIVQQWIGSYGQGASTQAALTEFKTRTTGIAAALRSDSLTHTATAGVNTRVVTDGTYTYLIAQPSHTWTGPGTTYTLNFPAGTTAVSADVLWESRTETVTAGAVSDTFANEYTVHVYRIGA